jgi:hypothetical protein
VLAMHRIRLKPGAVEFVQARAPTRRHPARRGAARLGPWPDPAPEALKRPDRTHARSPAALSSRLAASQSTQHVDLALAQMLCVLSQRCLLLQTARPP